MALAPAPRGLLPAPTAGEQGRSALPPVQTGAQIAWWAAARGSQWEGLGQPVTAASRGALAFPWRVPSSHAAWQPSPGRRMQSQCPWPSLLSQGAPQGAGPWCPTSSSSLPPPTEAPVAEAPTWGGRVFPGPPGVWAAGPVRAAERCWRSHHNCGGSLGWAPSGGASCVPPIGAPGPRSPTLRPVLSLSLK